MPGTRVLLHVGNHTFDTTQETLCSESQWFLQYFSDTPPEHDGSYFVDADGDTFHHLLSYMRYTKFPLLWTREHGFDYATYHKVGISADFFGLTSLVKWISEQKFEDAVKTITNVVAYEMRPLPTDTMRMRWCVGWNAQQKNLNLGIFDPAGSSLNTRILSAPKDIYIGAKIVLEVTQIEIDIASTSPSRPPGYVRHRQLI